MATDMTAVRVIHGYYSQNPTVSFILVKLFFTLLQVTVEAVLKVFDRYPFLKNIAKPIDDMLL